MLGYASPEPRARPLQQIRLRGYGSLSLCWELQLLPLHLPTGDSLTRFPHAHWQPARGFRFALFHLVQGIPT